MTMLVPSYLLALGVPDATASVRRLRRIAA
jgi:hypothetical protein